MKPDSPIDPAVILDRFKSLTSQRANLMGAVSEIDEKLRAMATILGLDPEDIGVAGNASPTSSKYDARRQGSLTEFMLAHLSRAPGSTRPELRKAALGSPEFGPKMRANPNGFYNQLQRLIGREEIVLVEDRLYLKGMQPKEEPRSLFNVTTFPGSGS